MRRMMVVLCCVTMASTLLSLLPANQVPPPEEELIVSAAASLTNAFGEIGKKFEAAHPGTKVVTNFGASGALLQQHRQGGPPWMCSPPTAIRRP